MIVNNSKKELIVFDTTLRDGEQSPGATLFLSEKLQIARTLEELGVDVIEAGFAAASPGDLESIQKISEQTGEQTTICSLARAVDHDIYMAAKALEKAKKPRIHTFMSTSDIHLKHQFRMQPDEALELIDRSVKLAASLCDDVEWSAMDATRSNPDFLKKSVATAIQAGATTINLPDTVGFSTPEEHFSLFQTLTQAYPSICFSAHCHDDLGLALANSLSAVRGGARQVECTLNGIGERAGNAALEEVVMAIHTRQDYYNLTHRIQTDKLYSASKQVSTLTSFPVQKNKAIVGANAFAHESGIHQDGMIKNRNTYEIVPAESVGAPQTQLILGKHSGRAALKKQFSDWGFELNQDELKGVFNQFKDLCDQKKHISDHELLSLFPSAKMADKKNFFILKNFKVEHQPGCQAWASITLETGQQNYTAESFGEGSLDAAYQAINQATQSNPQILSLELHSLSQGSDAQAEAKVELSLNNTKFEGYSRNADTNRAALEAYVSALNKGLLNTNLTQN